MEHKHTEGPWTFRPEAREIFGPPGSGVIVARLPEWGTAADAPDPSGSNAGLIAAAPDLLNALEALLSVSASHLHMPATKSAAERQARAAIAKATGAPHE
ncbi:hypothetical protein EGK70_007175 [Alcaligenes aquatilis]|uniref:hypothetical protein n=1 Tax=Alcaligenes aquatilis TaxID=323284 RepID=UPI000F67F40B|nr:hypothetical protein [Alcaligenes aquatilis]QXR37264.1 hypothetical protein EGK70_007175 [Alcaligenes aquatilis]